MNAADLLAKAFRNLTPHRREQVRFAIDIGRKLGPILLDALEKMPERKAAPSDGELALAALGLTWPCSEAEVLAAFRTRALSGHADRGGQADMGALTAAKDAALRYVRANGDNNG